jgi:hypothetical protein
VSRGHGRPGRGVAWAAAATRLGQTAVSLTLYRDVTVRRAVTEGLRLHAVDVLTAHEDGAGRLADTALLDPLLRWDASSSPRTKTCSGTQQNGNSAERHVLASSMRINAR